MIRVGWVGLVFVVLLAAVVSSGAGYAVDTPRDATVVAAPDATATLSFVGAGDIDSGRERAAPIVTLTNRFPVVLTAVTVTVRDPTPRVPRLMSYTVPESLQPSESAAVLADVICASGASEDWLVTVTARGGGVSVELSRSVTVSCTFEGPGGGPAPGLTTESKLENTTVEMSTETTEETSTADDSPTDDSSTATTDEEPTDTTEGDKMPDGSSTDLSSSEPVEGDESTTETPVEESES